MPNPFEGDPFDRSEKAKSTIAGLREKLATQTPEERAASLDAGYQLMLAEHSADPGYFDRQQARIDNDPTVIAEREKSEDLYRIRIELGYGAIGYDANKISQRRRSRMAPTEEEVTADKLAATEAYYDSLPRPEPTRR